MHDYHEAEIDALQLAMYVETSAGDTRAFRLKAPDHVLKLSVRWTEFAEKEKERRRQEHERTITRMRERVATMPEELRLAQERLARGKETLRACLGKTKSNRYISVTMDVSGGVNLVRIWCSGGWQASHLQSGDINHGARRLCVQHKP